MLFQRFTALLCIIAVTLAACQSTPSRPTITATISPELDQSLQSLSPKAHLRELDARANAATSPGKRAYFQLLSMELLMDYGRADAVKKRLTNFKPHALDKVYIYRLDLLKAQIALANDQAPVALQKLPKNNIDYPLPIQATILRTRGIALAKLGYMEESLKIRLQLDEIYQQMLPEKMQAMEANHQVIWSSLQSIPDDVLHAIEKEHSVLQGWVALSQTVNSAQSNGVNRDLAIANWQRQYAEHPAANTLAKTLHSHRDVVIKYPTAIALLLPLSGRYAGPAKAIREGFLASYFHHDTAQKPSIRIYDSGDSSETTKTAYEAAVKDGAKFIVGPLQKDAVATLASAKNLPVPALALNYASEDKFSSQVIQFGLLPEDEARQAAELAIIKDQTHAIVYAPNTKLGERLNKAFINRYTELGGKVLATEKYTPDSPDHKHPIKRSLNILQSQNRRSILQSVIKQKTEFEARRRQDVEAIFLVVTPQQARNFRAQLKFHDAGDISIYATSSAYSGILNKYKDKDLDGLVFSDMPWTLQGEHNHQFAKANKLWPKVLSKYPRLYALGLDAYRIIPYLARLRANPYERFPGLTGSIALNEQNQVQRELLWATFVNGRPEVMEFKTIEDHSLTDFEDELSYLNSL